MSRPTIHLPNLLSARGSPVFDTVLKEAILGIDPSMLPLQQGLRHGSHAIGEGFSVIIINVSQTPGGIRVRAGIQYRGMIAGCSCADDPTPLDETTEYCEVQLDIDASTAELKITLLPD